jgi:hypothetical protein
MWRQYCEVDKDPSAGFTEYYCSTRTSVQLMQRQYCEADRDPSAGFTEYYCSTRRSFQLMKRQYCVADGNISAGYYCSTGTSAQLKWDNIVKDTHKFM